MEAHHVCEILASLLQSLGFFCSIFVVGVVIAPFLSLNGERTKPLLRPLHGRPASNNHSPEHY